MGEIIHVTEVEVVDAHRLRLRFEDGIEGDLDFSGESWEGVFLPLADPDFFAEVTVDKALGTVVWPNGADIAPETVHTSVVKGSPTLLDQTPQDLPPSSTLPNDYITDFTIIDHGVVALTFADGLEGEVDLLDRLWGQSLPGSAPRKGSRRRFSITVRSVGLATWTSLPTRSMSAYAPGVWPEPLPA